MVLFGILFAINIIGALVALTFFIVGLSDGTVTTFNILIWAGMLGVMFSMPFAAWAMRMRGRERLGMLMLLPVALPALAAGALTLAMIVNPPNWR